MAAGMVAASIDLPIEPALGMAAMVPYGDRAQFQIMWRGVVQLCLRTNQYADIQCTEIFRDELRGYNPITGDVVFHPIANFKMRYGDAKVGDVVGYYASFRLVSGFEKKCYMSASEVMAHAKKYSKAYQYDLAKGKNTSAWSTDPVAMGRKTVLLRLLGRWGIKSVQIEKALKGDKQDFESAQQEAAERIAAETGTQVVDAEFEPNGETAKNTKKAKKKRKSAKKTEAKNTPQGKYHCSACEGGFDDPKMGGPNNNVAMCPLPGCGSLKVALNPDADGTPGFMKED
jgi:recombination protein RecT